MSNLQHNKRSKNAKFWRSRANATAYSKLKMKGIKKFRPDPFIVTNTRYCPFCWQQNYWQYDKRYFKKNYAKQIRNFCASCGKQEPPYVPKFLKDAQVQ